MGRRFIALVIVLVLATSMFHYSTARTRYIFHVSTNFTSPINNTDPSNDGSPTYGIDLGPTIAYPLHYRARYF